MGNSKPLTILIQEHKTIQKMIAFLNSLYQNPKKIDQPNIIYFDQIIDFFHIYADECHHGKEEKILFKKLQSKDLSIKDRSLMNELIEEHKLARKLVAELKNAIDKKMLKQIYEIFFKIINLYEQHIEKENTRFFPSAFLYFSKEEINNIFDKFVEVDREMIHKKYLQIVIELENSIK